MKYNDISIQIKRNIKVDTFLALLDIGVQKPAGLFVPVAELAKSNGNVIDSKLLQKEFDFTIPMANQTLIRSVHMGILEEIPEYIEKYQLTTLGEQLILSEGGRIFQKENGEYRIFITDDPLIPQQILTLQRVDKGYRHERNMRINDSIEVDSLFGIIQNLVRDSNENVSRLIDSADIQIEKCYDKLIYDRNRDLSAKIVITLTPDSVKNEVEVKWKDRKNIVSLDIFNRDLTFDLVFSELMKQTGNLENWNSINQALDIPFDIGTQDNIDFSNFTEVITLEMPSIQGFDEFESVKFSLPVRPQTNEDAEAWAKFLLLKKVQSVCNRENYLNYCNEIINRFNDLGKIKVKLPSQEKLANEIKESSLIISNDNSGFEYGPRSDKYWFLQTGLDLLSK